MKARRYMVLFAAVGLFACLWAGRPRNIMWSVPDGYSMPLALGSNNVKTGTFTLRSSRYMIVLVHQRPCPVLHAGASNAMFYASQTPCDIALNIHREYSEFAALFQGRITNANLAISSASQAKYELGYFETAYRGKLVMVVSNAAAQHDDSACHARVEIMELLPK
jgi:hypothetical protein